MAMEVDGEEVPVTSEPLALSILQLVRTSQQIHGLKHNDYQRYRCVQT